MTGRGARRAAATPRLQGTLRIALALALLVAVNFYVLYYRSGTSVPALWELASTGRQAKLSARLQGPPGTPPAPARPRLRARALPPITDFPRVSEIELKEGDTLRGVLQGASVPARYIADVESALRGALDPGGLGLGQSLTLFYDGDDRLAALDYRTGPAAAYHLERVLTGSAERFVSTHQTEPLTVRPASVLVSLQKDGELQAAVTRTGETPALAARITEVLACAADLPAEARTGDELHVVVEKIYLGSSFYRYGRLLALEYGPASAAGQATGRVRAFVRPPGPARAADGPPVNAGAALGAARDYFTESGESLLRTPCRAPIAWSRWPSPPAGTAARPTLRAERGHTGLDYPAPAGAPVVAVTAGRVSFIGPRGPSGTTVAVTYAGHSGPVEVSYQHLGRVAKGLAVGQPVRLRQLLGYVGTSGLPSRPAPHPRLHLAFRQGSKLLDPTKLKPTREAALPAAQRGAFAEHVAALAPLLEPAGLGEREPPDAVAAQEQVTGGSVLRAVP